MSEIYCRNCGNVVQPNDLYCRECGYLLNTMSNWQTVRVGLVIGFIPTGLAFLFFSLTTGLFYGLIIPLALNIPMGIPVGAIGALIGMGRKKNKRRHPIWGNTWNNHWDWVGIFVGKIRSRNCSTAVDSASLTQFL